MKVHDFAKQLGLPDSKVRYYDRAGLIQSGRQAGNNYRNFTDQDALNIYHAQMLRSFDMGVQEALEAKDSELSTVDGWVCHHIQDLETQIAWEEMRLTRLREMQAYFDMIQNHQDKLTSFHRELSYNIWNVNAPAPLSPEETQAIQMLAQSMPFSYIAIRISKESLMAPGEALDVSIGLGILERNRKKLGLELPPGIPATPCCSQSGLLLEVHDPFSMTKADIAPLMKVIQELDSPLSNDLVGRIYISCTRNGKFVHFLGLGLSDPEK